MSLRTLCHLSQQSHLWNSDSLEYGGKKPNPHCIAPNFDGPEVSSPRAILIRFERRSTSKSIPLQGSRARIAEGQSTQEVTVHKTMMRTDSLT